MTANMHTNNSKPSLAHLKSTTPLDLSSGTSHGISECLAGLGFDVHDVVSDTPGGRVHSTIANYHNKSGIYGIFVDVSLEKEDYGTIYVSASEEKISYVENALEKALGMQFSRIKF
jgi:hypothetical protein